jgi:protein gp37
MGNTTIGWTDKTYNPWIGCQQVTEEECGDCYAKRWAERHQLAVWGSLSGSNRHLTKTYNDPRMWNREAQAEGKRYKVFCASLADVFEPHPQVAEARKRLWTLIEETLFLDWQLLTKRPKFIQRLVPQSWLQTWPLHVWIGASVGTQHAAEKRIPYLLGLPAPVLFLSCEPLVEEITLAQWVQAQNITWVICGGYSGTQYRPMELSWARTLRDECQAYGVAFFMKQLGSVYAREHDLRNHKGEDMTEFPNDLKIRAFPPITLSLLPKEENR